MYSYIVKAVPFFGLYPCDVYALNFAHLEVQQHDYLGNPKKEIKVYIKCLKLYGDVMHNSTFLLIALNFSSVTPEKCVY